MPAEPGALAQIALDIARRFTPEGKARADLHWAILRALVEVRDGR